MNKQQITKVYQLGDIGNTKTVSIGDKISLLYSTFQNIKEVFLNNYKDEKLDWNLFYSQLHHIKVLDKITYYIQGNIFNGNDYDWNEGDTDDWLLRCFFRYKTKDQFKIGYLIKIKKEQPNEFHKYFCAICKKILSDIISDKIKYNNVKKRNTNSIVLMEDNEMNELQDLKDYVGDIISKLNFLELNTMLTKKESIVFSFILIFILENNNTLDGNLIKEKLKLSDSNYRKIITSIRKKYNLYKIENNL